MRKAIVLPFFVALLFSLIPLAYSPAPLAETVVRLDPATVELGPECCVNDTFTLKSKIDNFYDLGALALRIRWNTTFLDYVDHVVKTPVETHPDGVLHEPVIVFNDDVNATVGTYYVAVSSIYPAPSFYGSGIVFEITFKVIYQPLEPATFSIDYILHEFITYGSGVPLFLVENCSMTIHPHWNPADVNDDLKVDIFDVVSCARTYLFGVGDPFYCSRCDIAEPYGIIDIFDIVMICASYGEEYTP